MQPLKLLLSLDYTGILLGVPRRRISAEDIRTNAGVLHMSVMLRCDVLRYSYDHGAAVTKWEGMLDETLAERLFSHDYCAAVVLKCCSKNFTSTVYICDGGTESSATSV
eukprot:Plantae.Rhodophyta-Purpureofilum_apyrenoidigerum.ctg42680.p1 GENE.Plantae.Rhodophyta-Purpureofilum_apyrenoidigerum.ctg42680~~Plantae.Rhodophyta-Purpureofilum_apyrenoidigerum.ctg42680.p1  ORF type:complete len:109 (+),score=9.63 Plantae.Rhodophyta-Purpureofilum_apyrenoidigerum.ctg42680:299-625(+)